MSRKVRKQADEGVRNRRGGGQRGRGEKAKVGKAGGTELGGWGGAKRDGEECRQEEDDEEE